MVAPTAIPMPIPTPKPTPNMPMPNPMFTPIFIPFIELTSAGMPTPPFTRFISSPLRPKFRSSAPWKGAGELDGTGGTNGLFWFKPLIGLLAGGNTEVGERRVGDGEGEVEKEGGGDTVGVGGKDIDSCWGTPVSRPISIPSCLGAPIAGEFPISRLRKNSFQLFGSSNGGLAWTPIPGPIPIAMLRAPGMPSILSISSPSLPFPFILNGLHEFAHSALRRLSTGVPLPIHPGLLRARTAPLSPEAPEDNGSSSPPQSSISILLNKPTRIELRRGGESSDSFGGGIVIGFGVGSWGIAMVAEGSEHDCEENEGGDITASPDVTTSGCD
ncbi:hypothetical protein BDN71DRAFT_1260287 [Pleurotus eryngii]|uniref:Uncharacterized protein n=1 Tax=Pleurotus eryngii TaxID=5323 RepID=A0A9P6DJ65_PLEER|nr:hypothetical protein BDN71DRAFT_1260287 [Pleurotus eryngii]